MLRESVPNELFELISCSNRKLKCLGNQCVYSSYELPCMDFSYCDSCENQCEDTCDYVFDENEDEVETTEDGLEYESSDNDWTINNLKFPCLKLIHFVSLVKFH